MQFFSSCRRVETATWVHYIDANKTYGEKALRQLHKNAASYIEQDLMATPNKTAAARPPSTYLKNYQN